MVVQAKIEYDTKNNHPDEKNVKGLSYNDTYTIDPDYFDSREAIKNYISYDLKLVAGGGYVTNTIKNIKIRLAYIS